jgi:hypothetical protein
MGQKDMGQILLIKTRYLNPFEQGFQCTPWSGINDDEFVVPCQKIRTYNFLFILEW